MIALTFGVCGLTRAEQGHAFAPQAAAMVAARIPGALPLAAHWDPRWNAGASAEVERRLDFEETDPEASVPRHRWEPGNPLPAADPDAVAAGRLRVSGTAPLELERASQSLTAAFRTRQAANIVESLAALAIAASDLADPFQMTAPNLEETPGARAEFGDLVRAEDLAGLSISPRTWPPDAGDAGLELAGESVSSRGMVEDRFRAGDEASFAELRRERLNAALSLAGELVRRAWLEAGSPRLDGAAPDRASLGVWPNPVRGPLAITFTLERAETGRLELFDLAGRRVWRGVPFALREGPQRLAIESGALKSLPAGLYLARLTTPSLTAQGRLAWKPQ